MSDQADPMDRSDSDSSDDSSSSSDDEEFENKVDPGEVDRLEMQLRANPFVYDNHHKYITALRANKQTERAREASENMSSKYPLPEEMWVAWTRDEAEAAKTEEQRNYVLELYKRGMKDYQSVSLCVNMCAFLEEAAFAKSPLPEAAALKTVRDAYEQCLTSVGLDMFEGFRLWAAYRTFEQRIVGALSGDDAQRDKQIEKVRAVYKRQLSVPHLSLEATYADYVGWEEAMGPKGVAPAAMQTGYKTATKALQDRLAHEESVKAAAGAEPDYNLVPAWRQYLNFEETKGDPGRVITLYERAVKRFCLVLDLWQSYVAYLSRTIKTPALILDVYARAVRNVAWSGELWAAYLRYAESQNHSDEKLSDIFERGLVAGIQDVNELMVLFDVRIDSMRRAVSAKQGAERETLIGNMRDVFQREVDYFSQVPESTTAIYVQKYWATLEFRLFKNVERGRKLWNELTKSYGADYSIWRDYIQLERSVGNIDSARALFKKAAAAPLPDHSLAWSEWILFEREFGTLDQYNAAAALVKTKAIDEQQRAQQEIQQLQQQQDAKAEKRREHDKQRKEKFREEKKRLREEEGQGTNKKQKVVSEKSGDSHENRKSDSKSTLYIQNLPWNVDEARLREILNNSTEIREVRFPLDDRGRSRGFAFVQFTTEEAASEVLKLDQTEVGGRKISVIVSNNVIPDDMKKEKPKKQIYGDTNTAFVNNLPFSCVDSDLQEIFAPGGGLKSIRIVKKDGNCRGFAYVEFEDAQSLEAAIKLDQTKLKGRPIHVAKSAPKGGEGDHKGAKSDAHPNPVKPYQRNASTADAEPRAAPKSRLMVPRAIKSSISKPAAAPKSGKDAPKTNNEPKPSASSEQSGTTPAGDTMSNSQFRAFLKK